MLFLVHGALARSQNVLIKLPRHSSLDNIATLAFFTSGFRPYRGWSKQSDG